MIYAILNCKMCDIPIPQSTFPTIIRCASRHTLLSIITEVYRASLPCSPQAHPINSRSNLQDLRHSSKLISTPATAPSALASRSPRSNTPLTSAAVTHNAPSPRHLLPPSLLELLHGHLIHIELTGQLTNFTCKLTDLLAIIGVLLTLDQVSTRIFLALRFKLNHLIQPLLVFGSKLRTFLLKFMNFLLSLA